ncbi:Methyltransferase domain-containing protein [Noviherbaspirillum humi]|uniref:Methyltransferase domain-containing protein n=2 Tax=Noviherbaspirillum humi TaxID=1688639 RepID=A0A239LK76_9BURK|nr:Methyltransferase domain-containing protein [Noviherbaspirillum humi]
MQPEFLPGTHGISLDRMLAGTTDPKAGRLASADVTKMDAFHRMSWVLEHAVQGLPEKIKAEVSQLISPQSLLLLLGFLAAQATPIGWIADLAVLGLTIREAWYVINSLNRINALVSKPRDRQDLLVAANVTGDLIARLASLGLLGKVIGAFKRHMSKHTAQPKQTPQAIQGPTIDVSSRRLPRSEGNSSVPLTPTRIETNPSSRLSVRDLHSPGKARTEIVPEKRGRNPPTNQQGNSQQPATLNRKASNANRRNATARITVFASPPNRPLLQSSNAVTNTNARAPIVTERPPMTEWQPHYEKIKNNPPLPTLVNFLNDWVKGSRPPGLAVDMGAGAGLQTAALSRYGWDVVAIDADAASPYYVRQALARNRDRAHANKRSSDGYGRVVIKVQKFQDVKLPPDGTVDLVWSGSLSFVPRKDMPAILQKVRRALGKDGRLVITLFGPEHHLTGSAGITVWKEEEVRAVLKGFRILSLQRKKTTTEFTNGSGVYDLVEVDAVKE